MGLAQTLLTIAAISLLSMITLTLNSSYLTTNQVMIESEFSIEAISIAESYLERAIGKSFDEKTITSQVTQISNFTYPPARESGEIKLTDFDDFDDFHGFNTKDTTERAIYNVSISVAYVNENNPDQAIVGKSWYKRMTITVSQPDFMPSQPIQLQFIYSYF